MSQPPYAAPPAAPPYPGAARRRPSAWWFALGGVLVLCAPVLFVGGLVWTLRPMLSPDAHFPADGGQHQVSVAAHSQRAVFVPRGAVPPSCSVSDATGAEIPARSVSGSYDSTFGGRPYRAYRTFDTGDGEVVVSCRMPTLVAPVRIYVAGVPSSASVITGVAISVIGPIVLGLAGLTVIVVVALLRSRRPSPPRSL